MAIQLGLAKLSPTGTQAMLEQGPVERERYLRERLEAVGGRLLGFSLGKRGARDVVTLLEVPDDRLGAPDVNVGLSLTASGAYERAEFFRLYDAEAVRAAGAGVEVAAAGSEADETG
jgi:uncharacterized protein with GYD domain